MGTILNKRLYTVVKRKLASWQHLPFADKILFFESVFYLGYARLIISLIPFRYIAPSLGRLVQQTPQKEDGEVHAEALRVARAMSLALRYTPWESPCLPQAIAMQRMLRRRGLGWNLYLGLMQGDENERLKAHAWLRNGSVILCGAQGHQQFTVLSIFSSEGGEEH